MFMGSVVQDFGQWTVEMAFFRFHDIWTSVVKTQIFSRLLYYMADAWAPMREGWVTVDLGTGLLMGWWLGFKRNHPVKDQPDSKYSKKPRQKLQGFFWLSLRGHIASLLTYPIDYNQVIKVSLDSRERKLDSISWWKSGNFTLQKSR